MGMSENQ